MSWSIVIPPKPHTTLLKDLETYVVQAKAQHPDSADQIEFAADTVHILINEGIFGSKHGHDYAIDLVGHTNADHVPGESLSININTHVRKQAS